MDHYRRAYAGEARAARPVGVDAAAQKNVPRANCALEPLQDVTIRWLTQLPPDVQPVELARLFPRIANKLCDLWDDLPFCGRYLAGLLATPRDGSRAGFPMAVEAELAELLDCVDDFGSGLSQTRGRGIR